MPCSSISRKISLLVSLVPIFLFLSSASFSFSFGGDKDPLFPSSQKIPTSGAFGERSYGMVIKRYLDENSTANSTSTGSGDEEAPLNPSSLVLAEKRTYRKDPLDGFKKYTGGWNISNKHYWASVGYTAAPFFVVAGIWFLVFGLCLLVMSLCFCCCRRKPYGYSRAAYALSLIFLMFFTVMAILGCIILYIGQGKFHSSTSNTLHFIVDQADTTVGNLTNVSGYLAAAKQVQVDQVFLPGNVQTDIDQIQTQLNSSAITLSERAEKNSKDMEDFIDSTRLALIMLSAFMLLMTFLGFIFSIFGLQFLVYILVITGWIMVTGTFILCGIFLLLHKFYRISYTKAVAILDEASKERKFENKVEWGIDLASEHESVTTDTCVAMDQWVQNPTAHTSLDDILPCVDNATAQDTLSRSKEVTYQLVDVVNEVITNVSNINFAPSFVPLYYNQSGPVLPLLCNPFHPDLSNRTCSAGEVDFDNATQVWSTFVCQVSPNGVCMTTGRLTPSLYSQMAAGINVSFGLYHYGPYLVSLQDCSFVRQTFTEIYTTHCSGLQQYSKWVYIGLLMVAVAVMLSLLFWVIYGRERRHRLYTKEHISKPIEECEGDKQT